MITLKTRIYFLTILLQSVTVFSIFSPDSYYSYNGNHAYQYNLTDNSYAESSVYGPPRSIINMHSTGPLVEYGGFKPSVPIFPSISHFGPTVHSNHLAPVLGQAPSPPGFGAPDSPPIGAGCLAAPAQCTNSKYRTLDGSCNNLKYPQWGAANTRYGRLVAPRYADGIHSPPTSVQNHDELPLARLVSIVMFPDLPVPDPLWTLVTMSWGQIITHDMSMALGTTQAKRHSTRCCDDDGRLFSNQNPLCFPIVIPEDDPVFSKYKRMCMNFVRSTTDVETGCNPGTQPAEQLVTVTHWMDASLVYGNSEQVTNALREFAGGRLRVEFKGHRPFPPTTRNKTAVCDLPNEREPCYQFGDRRANQNPQLTVLQILLLREHNRIATILSHVNPHWDDETLFQEARRILIAEYQHINYYEYLPIILGTENMLKYKLIHKTKGYTKDYNDHVDPSVLNEHATAAFRYFHSSIQGHFQLIEEGRHILNSVRLSDFFNRPVIIEENGNLDHLTRGLSTQSQEEVDPFFTSEITDFLFRRERPFGRDLRAIDIQRGRDHGLGSYNDLREFCGLNRAHKFEDFLDFIDPERVEKLSILYAHPDDVDLTVGGSLEAHAPGTLAGPTFLCILLEQFYRTRVSDRHFYELGGQPGSFSLEQLKEIKKASLARIFCDNGDEIHTMQPSAFLKISSSNPLILCDDYEKIPAIDLTLWKEVPHLQQGYVFDDYKK